jgi:hypothetical protein
MRPPDPAFGGVTPPAGACPATRIMDGSPVCDGRGARATTSGASAPDRPGAQPPSPWCAVARQTTPRRKRHDLHLPGLPLVWRLDAISMIVS